MLGHVSISLSSFPSINPSCGLWINTGFVCSILYKGLTQTPSITNSCFQMRLLLADYTGKQDLGLCEVFQSLKSLFFFLWRIHVFLQLLLFISHHNIFLVKLLFYFNSPNLKHIIPTSTNLQDHEPDSDPVTDKTLYLTFSTSFGLDFELHNHTLVETSFSPL